jgi:ABC-type multidrug transport system permease subunit
MPQIIQTLANFIPAHHWLAILRGIILKGSTLEDLLPNVVWLFILGTIIGYFSLRYIRKALD